MAKLTYRARKGMAASAFAIPSQREGGKGGYPIPDIAHARNALARVAQHGTPAEVSKVHHAVAARYPELAKRSEAIKGDKKHNPSHNPT